MKKDKRITNMTEMKHEPTWRLDFAKAIYEPLTKLIRDYEGHFDEWERNCKSFYGGVTFQVDKEKNGHVLYYVNLMIHPVKNKGEKANG